MSGTTTSLTVRVQLAIRRRPGRKTVVTPTGAGASATTVTRADPALLKALARAFRYQRLLDEGHYATISEMAAAERLERGYLGSLLRLTLLAPDIVEMVLNSQQPSAVELSCILGSLPAHWLEQHAKLLSARAPC